MTLTAKWRDRCRPVAVELAELFAEVPSMGEDLRRLEARLAWARIYETHCDEIEDERKLYDRKGNVAGTRTVTSTMAYRIWRDELAIATGTLRGRMLRAGDPVAVQRELEAAGQQVLFS